MTEPDAELDLLFQDMASESALPEPAGNEARRRQRAIGGMRAMHRSLAEAGEPPKRRARHQVWIGVTAALALAGTALAAARGALPFSFGARQSAEPPPAARTPAQAPPRPVALAAAPALAPLVSPGALTEPSPPAAVTGTKPQPGAKSVLTPSAELEEVNRLFVEAKRARREHRDAEALAFLQQLLTKHPSSVLAHEATVERFRTLARLGRTSEAERYARAYLARYPSGFAAEEARRMLGGAPP